MRQDFMAGVKQQRNNRKTDGGDYMMNTITKVMDMKTKAIKIAMQILLSMSFIGYFSSLYRGLAGSVSTYTNFIIVFVCLSGSLFVKPEKESRAFLE